MTHQEKLLQKALDDIHMRLTENEVQGSSALGIWTLAAYLSASFEEIPENVHSLLGMSRGESLATLEHLYKTAPESITLAFTGWSGVSTTGIARLFDETNKIAENHLKLPQQLSLDKWANEESKGIFEEFPTDVSDLAALFATMVATDIKWAEKFEVISNSTISESWNVDQVLYTEKAEVKFFKHKENRYASFVRRDANKELSVYCVMGLDSDENLGEVSFKHAVADASGSSEYEEITPDQALQPGLVSTFNGSKKDIRVEIPAWEHDSNFDVQTLYPEFETIAYNLNPNNQSGVKQFVKASYDAEGFKAAAVTAMLMRAVASSVTAKVYDVTFSKPFNAVAVGKFNGENSLPLFSFFVNEAVEAEISKS